MTSAAWLSLFAEAVRAAAGSLREQADPDLCEPLLLDCRRRASGLTLREAGRRLPAERRARILDRLHRNASPG